MATRQPTGRIPHFDSLEQEVFLGLWRTYDRLRMIEEELFSRYDLTPQQYNALRLLRAVHPDSMPTLALASRLVSRAPDITRLLDRLAERELLVRERLAENRRVVRVAISATGLALLNEISEPLRECHRRQLGHLSAGKLKQLDGLLREVRGPHETEDSSWK